MRSGYMLALLVALIDLGLLVAKKGLPFLTRPLEYLLTPNAC